MSGTPLGMSFCWSGGPALIPRNEPASLTPEWVECAGDGSALGMLSMADEGGLGGRI